MPNPVTPAFETKLRGVLPPATFREPSSRYAEEPRGLIHGRPGLVLAPATTDEVASILRAAGAAGVAVIPYSGGTGLVGGQVSPDLVGPIVLSLERMARIRHVDAQSAVMEVEAGAILADIQAAADDAGMLFPLTLASQGSARIGGLLSTNAGGVNVIRYGNARDLCLGVEAVLPDGSLYRGLTALRKNNLGYDLRNLLIGAEGTLGVITAASLKLMAKPGDQAAAFFVVESPAAALELLALARAHVGEVLSAFELINGTGLTFLDETGLTVRQPFADKPDWMCLVDLGLMGAEGTATDALMGLFEAADAAGLVRDGVISQSEGQRRDFWTLREMIPEANKRIGSISSHDIAVPVARIPDFIAEAPRRLAKIGTFRINSFGHMGDGNLHYNVFPPKGRSRDDYAHLRADVRRSVYDLVQEMAGSISAEHGIGRFKLEEQDRYGDPGLLAAMQAIKTALDPRGIMNPGAALRS